MAKAIAQTGSALRPRARILRTLGEELISSETVAILELVKNSYDADACVVLVRFSQKADKGQGQIEIVDDGHGMDMLTIQRAWMEPATDYKKKLRRSVYLDRRLLGEKGVGRFASARLAEELELVTRAADSSKEIFAIFDWTQFDKEDIYLDEVLILTEERKPSELVEGRALPAKIKRRGPKDLRRDGTHGTILRMLRLKKTWNAAEFDDLRRGLSRLVSPFEDDQGFRIFLQLPSETVGTATEVEPPTVIKYPHYTIEGSVEADGAFELSYIVHAEGKTEPKRGWYRHRSDGTSKDLLVVEKKADLEGTKAIVSGPFSFKVLVWDRDQLDSLDQKLGTGIRSIRKDLDSIAGISIYRDGFRVLPYGEPENDWLRLDIRRVQNPTMRLSNNQLTGYIKIGADTNPSLKDQSNREGLDNNDAYSDLQEIMRAALAELEAARYRQKQEERKPTTPGRSLLESPDVTELRKKVAALKPDKETLHLFDETTKRWEDQVGRIREVLSRYHTLATLGQLIDKVVHDSRQPLSTIQSQSTFAREAISDWLEEAKKDSDCYEHLVSLDGRLQKVKDSAGLIDLVLRRIEPLGGRRRGRPTKLYLEEIIRSAFAFFDKEIKDQGIKVTLPDDMNLVRVDSAELQEVIINLITNSLYWLDQVAKDRRKIVVKCTRPTPGEVEIIFADSGPGVARKNRDAIFEPYFSTKPDGVGLGLVIAGEIIRDYYDGTLELLNSGPLDGATFRIVLRKRV